MTRLDSLTGLRWWAAFGVFAYHMGNLAPLPIANVLVYGNYGVTFFFVLSGFVLTWSARPTVRPQTFWFRRFARIYPAHVVALLLAIPVFYSFVPDLSQWWVKPVDIGILALSFLLLQGWSRDPVVLFSGNPAAWTLTCEAFFYALHPMLNRALAHVTRRGALVCAVAVVAVAVGYRILVLTVTGFGGLPWPALRLTEFVIGMCVARAMALGWRFRVKPIVFYLLAAAFVIFLVATNGDEGSEGVVWFIRASSNEWVILICTLIIAAVASRDQRGDFSLLRTRLMVVLGDLSYSFYLVHATVVYAVLSISGLEPPRWRNLLWYAAVLALSLGVAALLHYLVERPVERRLRAWWDARELDRIMTASRPNALVPSAEGEPATRHPAT